MWEDPIVAEVNRIREKLAAEFNYDVKAIFADLRKRQESLGDRLVRQRKTVEPEVDSGHHCSSAGSTPSEAATPFPSRSQAG